MFSPILLKDFYKAGHFMQYPKGTEYIYSNFTPRKNNYSNSDKIVFFGLQYLIYKYLIEDFNDYFFNKDHDMVIDEYKSLMDESIGGIPVSHISKLHQLGFLPIEIKAIDEGSIVNVGIPVLTIINTIPEFYWVTNMIETLLSNILWMPCTSATTAWLYKKEFIRHSKKTGYDKGFVDWQGHDFSMRGMPGIEASYLSGAGHLISFTGTDTIPAILMLKKYYGDKSFIGGSVPATEHSVMCAGGKINEFEMFRRLITEIYPKGIVSIVSDTWDLWKVLTDYLPRLKNEINMRDGRVVIRPDSGNPVDIICGTFDGAFVSDDRHNFDEKQKGAYELLWDVFGGTINENGYKVLNPKIGLIYGDAITIERQKEILLRLENKGFCASNLVLGIGSYTYQYVTRDVYGFAMKATWSVIEGKENNIFKDPITDNGVKKSAKGLLCVYGKNGDFKLKQNASINDEKKSKLKTVFKDGNLIKRTSVEKIRSLVSSCL